MLTAMQGSAPPLGLAKVVFSETEGNPFFVEEVYQHLAEEGRLFDERGEWKEGLRADAIDVPEGVRLVIGRRLERVGAAAGKVLTAAAVIGRTFPLDLLQSIVDASEDEVLDALEAAEGAQLVAAQRSAREARYEFVHELIRSTLLHGLSLPRRQRMHLKVADAVERIRAAALDSHASVLAHHLYQAGAAAAVDRTVKYLALAASLAVAAGAFEEALDVLQQVETLEIGGEHPLAAELAEARGGARMGLGHIEEVEELFERAFAVYSRRSDAPGMARVSRALATTRIARKGSFAAAVEGLERAVHALPFDAMAERVLLNGMLTMYLQAEGRFEEAAVRLEEVVSAAAETKDPHAQGIACLTRAVCTGVLGELNETDLRNADALLNPSASWARALLSMHASTTSVVTGRLADADDHFRQFAVASRVGVPGKELFLQWLPSVLGIMRAGDLDDFVTKTRSAISPFPFHKTSRLAVGLFYRGETAEALEIMQGLLSQPASFHDGILEANVFVATALTRGKDAMRLFAAAASKLPQPRRLNLWGAWQALLAVVPGLAAAGDAARCGALYPLTIELLNRGVVFFDLMLTVGPTSVELSAGIAAHAAALRDQATGHFERARRQAHDAPNRLLQPAVEYWYGRSLLDASHPSDVARGRGMIEAAAADFESLKMPVYVELAKRTLLK